MSSAQSADGALSQSEGRSCDWAGAHCVTFCLILQQIVCVNPNAVARYSTALFMLSGQLLDVSLLLKEGIDEIFC